MLPSPSDGKLRLMGRRASAADWRRKVSTLQTLNDDLVTFLCTLPADALKHAPSSVRKLVAHTSPTLGGGTILRPHTVLPTLTNPRAQRLLHAKDSYVSPPADSPQDPLPGTLNPLNALQDPVLSRIQRRPEADATPQPKLAPAHQTATAQAAVDPVPLMPPPSPARAHPVDPMPTPSSEVRLVGSHGSRHPTPSPLSVRPSLEGLRKDLFSPRVYDEQLQRDGTICSTVLSPVAERTAKGKGGLKKPLRVSVPQSSLAEVDDQVAMTPLKQARHRARDKEAAAAAAATPLATPGSRGPRNKSLASPISGGGGGAGAPSSRGGLTPASHRRKSPGGEVQYCHQALSSCRACISTHTDDMLLSTGGSRHLSRTITPTPCKKPSRNLASKRRK